MESPCYGNDRVTPKCFQKKRKSMAAERPQQCSSIYFVTSSAWNGRHPGNSANTTLGRDCQLYKRTTYLEKISDSKFTPTQGKLGTLKQTGSFSHWKTTHKQFFVLGQKFSKCGPPNSSTRECVRNANSQAPSQIY